MSTADVIPAPAADAVTFRLHRSRLWLTTVLTLAPLWLLLRAALLVTLLARGIRLDASDFVEAGVYVVSIPLAAGVGALLGAGRHLGWVRASTAGLELAATRRAAVFLPWPAVESVRLRFRGPFTELVVTPTSLDAASVASLGGGRPRLRRRSGSSAFLVDVGSMTPGPSVLLAELNRRLDPR